MRMTSDQLTNAVDTWIANEKRKADLTEELNQAARDTARNQEEFNWNGVGDELAFALDVYLHWYAERKAADRLRADEAGRWERRQVHEPLSARRDLNHPIREDQP